MMRKRIVAGVTAAIVLSCSVMANEAPPRFDPASVPERLRVLEGRTAYIKISREADAPLHAAQGAAPRGNVSAQIVTPGNTTSVPVELALREREIDRFIQGYISEADIVAFMEKQLSSSSCCVLLREGTAVRIIAPRVDDGFATQVLPLTGKWSENPTHLWVNSCFLRLTRAADQELLNRGKVCR